MCIKVRFKELRSCTTITFFITTIKCELCCFNRIRTSTIYSINCCYWTTARICHILIFSISYSIETHILISRISLFKVSLAVFASTKDITKYFSISKCHTSQLLRETRWCCNIAVTATRTRRICN